MVVPPKVPHLRGQEATVSAAGERRLLHGSAPKGTPTARQGSYRWFGNRHMVIGRPIIPPRNVTLAHRLSTLAPAKPATPETGGPAIY